MKCQNEDCENYPIYGLAPHTHNLEKTGCFIGSTQFLEKKDWPPDFIEDPNETGMGFWVCPECLGKKEGME